MSEMEMLIDRFYLAFAARDAGAMATCYHQDVHFRDEVFDLKGAEASGMWRMLCAKGKDMRIQHSDIHTEGDVVHAHWEAHYTFGATGRHVHNIIEATFRFSDGKIIEHTDQFDFHNWSKQALGTTGLLLGWTPYLRSKVQSKAAAQLKAYLNKNQ
ncbi:MAG: ketosteroid isomerase [Planctomycetota bacterium]|nr:MAG: ketosteroid isomerase [Planctomycetota bacterium]